jgi:hypothetical protein
VVKRCGLIGAGIGMALFAVFGLMQGALIGGTAGLAVANHIFGQTTLEIMADELLPRIIIAASMLTGVVLSLVAFVVGAAAAGAAFGYALALLATPAEAPKSEMAAEGAAKKQN